MAASRAV
jgi:hypothetical protein